ncbi:MAG: hypothetical protein DRI74_04360 [Bacteroidetes bacterium]|nr:MAG: hypothetical protein DRI74_04360 [Bacteroidota bacterium]
MNHLTIDEKIINLMFIIVQFRVNKNLVIKLFDGLNIFETAKNSVYLQYNFRITKNTTNKIFIIKDK